MIEVGKFLIANVEEDAPPTDRILLRLHPSFAYGFGWEIPTQNILLHLQAEDLDGKRVLDVGTGTGILAIAAAKLGAKVTATDIREDVLIEAVRNFTTNDVYVELVADPELTGYDLVVCNIGDEWLERLRSVGCRFLATNSEGQVFND